VWSRIFRGAHVSLAKQTCAGRDVVTGDLTIQGNLKGVASISEPLQVALENGAVRALVPISNPESEIELHCLSELG